MHLTLIGLVPCVTFIACCVAQAAGQQGSTAPPPPEQEVDLHFIAFVEHDGEQQQQQQGEEQREEAHTLSVDCVGVDACANPCSLLA